MDKDKERILNEETLKAVLDAEDDIDMIKCVDIEDLFESLEI